MLAGAIPTDACPRNGTGNAEIEHFDRAVAAYEAVAGLEIGMHHTAVVRELQGLTQCFHDREGLLEGQPVLIILSALGDKAVEWHAFEQFHGNKDHVARTVTRKGVHLHDIRMSELTLSAGFAGQRDKGLGMTFKVFV